MDWFAWLSKTNLEPPLIYNYGLTFARNELRLQDATHFNHEFLQSMGISVAKHRLEILQLAKKEYGVKPRKLSAVIKKCLRKCVRKFGFGEEAEIVKAIPEPDWCHEKWRSAFVRKQGNESEEVKEERPFHRTRGLSLSGPLDGRMQEKVLPNKVLRLSGPIDGSTYERSMYTDRSPVMSRAQDGRSIKSPILPGSPDSRSPKPTTPESPRANGHCSMAKVDIDFDDDHALWPTLFQDLKPT